MRLAAMIDTNYYDAIMGCMRDINAIDLCLARTGIMVTNSRRKLNSGKELIVNGALKITKLAMRRERLRHVDHLLSHVQVVQVNQSVGQ
jgi:hypothetical protein